MTKTPKTRRRYKPIKFGDPYDPRTVEGHYYAVKAAAEERQFKRMMKEREALREAMKPLHVKLWEWLCKKFN